MATFNKPIATNQGIALLKAEVAGTDSITFTKTVFSSDDYSQTADSDIANLTAIQSMDLTATAQAFQDVNGNTKVRAIGYNNSVNQAFYVKTYALYARNKAGNEILFAVASSQTADFVPAFNNAQLTQIAYTFTFAIDQTQNITLSDQHEVTVTQADLASINNYVNSNASSASSAIASNASSINSVQSSVTANSSAIASNASSISNLQSTVSSNSSAIANNSKNINNLQTSLNKATDNANSIESKADKKDLETVSDKLSLITGEAKGYANVIDHTKPISEVRKTGVYRSDAQYNDYKDTPDGNNNFTLLVNYDGYFLHQCYVSENVWIRDENRGFKWRKIAMDTDINSLIDKIDDLSSKGMVYRGNITTGDDFNNFTKVGFYRVDLNGLNDNMPPNSINSRGLLINTNADGYLKQEFFDLNFIRSCIRYSRDNIWSNWQQLATNDYVDQNIRQVNANINDVQNQVYDVDNHSFKRYDGWISGYVNSLDDLLKLPSGFSQIGNAAFLPDGSSKWGMINKYTLNDVFVTYFDQYNGSIWTITKVGGTWSPWRKIGGGKPLGTLLQQGFYTEDDTVKTTPQAWRVNLWKFAVQAGHTYSVAINVTNPIIQIACSYSGDINNGDAFWIGTGGPQSNFTPSKDGDITIGITGNNVAMQYSNFRIVDVTTMKSIQSMIN